MIVALAGQYACGKDSAADYLCQQLNRIYPESWYRDALANNVKRIYMETFRVSREFIETWKRTEEIPPGFKMPVRKGLTFIGDGFRDVQQDVWIESLMHNLEGNTVISDCRYINEAIYFQKHNGITILMWRPGYENDYQNRSEQELMPYVNILKNQHDRVLTDEFVGENIANIPFDIWIRNDGEMRDLHTKIDQIVVPYIREKIDGTRRDF